MDERQAQSVHKTQLNRDLKVQSLKNTMPTTELSSRRYIISADSRNYEASWRY